MNFENGIPTGTVTMIYGTTGERGREGVRGYTLEELLTEEYGPLGSTRRNRFEIRVQLTREEVLKTLKKIMKMKQTYKR